jgi:hypothetical protein
VNPDGRKDCSGKGGDELNSATKGWEVIGWNDETLDSRSFGPSRHTGKRFLKSWIIKMTVGIDKPNRSGIAQRA